MKKFLSILLCGLLFLALPGGLSCALAVEVACPAGGFSLELPDDFREQPLSPREDPELCLYWQGDKITLVAYATYLGEVAGSDLFQVLTGDETESGMVVIGGMSMLYAAGTEGKDAWRTYSWMDRGNNVTLTFSYPKKDKNSKRTVEDIMQTIAFDAGH